MSSNRSQKSARSENSQQRSERPNRRTRKLTSRGKEFMLEQLHANYRSSKRAWRACINRLVSSLVTEDNCDIIKLQSADLQTKMTNITKALEGLEKELTPEEKNDVYGEYDNFAQENTEALRQANNKLKEISKTKERSTRSRSSARSSTSTTSNGYYISERSSSKNKKLLSREGDRSSRGQQSNKSSSLNGSSSSESSTTNTSRRSIDYTKDKHNIQQSYEDRLDEIHKQKLQLELNERKLQREYKRLQERAEPDEDLHHYKPKGNLLLAMPDDTEQNEHQGQLPRDESKKQLLQRYLETSEFDFEPERSEEIQSQAERLSAKSSLVERELINIVKTLAQNQRRLDLPSPEPTIFSGDYLQYPSWIQAFDTLIENKTTEPKERIHYLRKYVTGEAKEAIDGLLLLNSDDAYRKAKEVLMKRYGDPFTIAHAYRQKLESWPRIQNSDAKGLRRFADFLIHCEIAMVNTRGLHVLNDDLENRKLATKLPKWLVNRWTREAYQYKENYFCFPPFKEFVKFVNKEADIVNDPVFSLDALEIQTNKKSKDIAVKSTKMASSFQSATSKETSFQSTGAASVTEVSPANLTSHCKQSNDVVCILCSSQHTLDQCEQFLEKSVPERKNFASANRFCFACLNQGHRSKECKNHSSKNVLKRVPTSTTSYSSS